jgi:hypothetical protein
LFFSIAATLSFLKLAQQPGIRLSTFYVLLLTLCLYTEPYSYLPAIGYLLSLFRFTSRPQQRQAVWFVLSATVIPVLLFLPYYLWSRPQLNPNWLVRPTAGPLSYVQAIRGFTAHDWIAFVLPPLLLGGMAAGAWASVRAAAVGFKQIALFCLLSGFLSTLVATVAMDTWGGEVFSAGQLLAAVPAVAILFAAGLEWSAGTRAFRIAGMAIATCVLVLCAIEDVEYLASRTEDLQKEADAIAPELTKDSCVVFVSEGVSKDLFLVFDPELDRRECMEFFHRRVVLAIHPYVRPDQRHDVESYFRGLGFYEVKRMQFGPGQVVIVEQPK